MRPTTIDALIIQWLRWEERNLALLIELVSPERRRRLEPMLEEVREQLAKLQGSRAAAPSDEKKKAA